ncbi:MAG TPA: hypothetical protein VLJ39_10525 [Tepidisphaeraceae bacterium]|nr:hypothetical protein [Tepidisphaeraceae bacterium]
MGQAAVDLPDPLNPPTASAASTDDLLAQMAGEEIDRMLAESEREASAAPNPVPTPALLPSTAAGSSPAITSTPRAEDPDESAAAELDAILGKAQTDSGQDPVAAVAALGQAPPKSEAGVGTNSDPFDEDDLLAAERGALNSSGGRATGGLHAGADLDDGAPSLLVRMLGWINFPLDACSDDVRETVGKIAILTLVNALAVLAYVLFLRHHG